MFTSEWTAFTPVHIPTHGDHTHATVEATRRVAAHEDVKPTTQVSETLNSSVVWQERLQQIDHAEEDWNMQGK